MASERRAVRVRIAGRVQGVNFRAWTRDEAERLGLDGWVRNEADGSVTALLAGSRCECGRDDRAAAPGTAGGGGVERDRRGSGSGRGGGGVQYHGG